jgi:DNA invertase Pin-like site-specific DNA recombinase
VRLTSFIEDTPTAVLVRQVLGAVAEFEKATLVAKLAAGRRRKRRATGKEVEGRKGHAEKRPEIVALARELRRRRPKPTLRAISAELAVRGHLAGSGKPFEPSVVARMLSG